MGVLSPVPILSALSALSKEAFFTIFFAAQVRSNQPAAMLLTKKRNYGNFSHVPYITIGVTWSIHNIQSTLVSARAKDKNNNPSNNFCGLSFDKTDDVIQNQTMVIRRYPPSDLISVVWFYFDGRNIKKQANVQAELLIGPGQSKRTFCKVLFYPR